MRRKLLAGMFFLLLACSGFYQKSFAQDKKEQIKIIGRVIATDDSINVSSMPVSHDLVIEIVKLLEGNELASHIKVVYRPLHGQKGLPKEMWSSQSQWLFTLQRAKDEDELCKEPVKGWRRTKPGTDQTVPDFEKLPCYLLSPGEFKRR